MKAYATKINDYIWQAYNLPVPQAEYKFHSTRKWRIDYAFPDVKLAVEIEGGVFTRGRHVRGGGFSGDMEKYNALTEQGWRLLRYTPKAINFDEIRKIYASLLQ